MDRQVKSLKYEVRPSSQKQRIHEDNFQSPILKSLYLHKKSHCNKIQRDSIFRNLVSTINISVTYLFLILHYWDSNYEEWSSLRTLGL